MPRPDVLYDDEPILTITIEEAIAFINCPFSNNFANEANYPGYNDVIRKIAKFAYDHQYDLRKEQ